MSVDSGRCATAASPVSLNGRIKFLLKKGHICLVQGAQTGCDLLRNSKSLQSDGRWDMSGQGYKEHCPVSILALQHKSSFYKQCSCVLVGNSKYVP